MSHAHDICLQAYAAGCNIAILAGNFERVQIIPGVAHGNIKVTCIDCSTDTGKVSQSVLHVVVLCSCDNNSKSNDSGFSSAIVISATDDN